MLASNKHGEESRNDLSSMPCHIETLGRRIWVSDEVGGLTFWSCQKKRALCLEYASELSVGSLSYHCHVHHEISLGSQC